MKVKDLPFEIIEQLVVLECQNILPVLASVGIQLTEKDMREQLKLFEESDVVVCETSGIVDGFLIYDVTGSEAMIITFNLRKRNSKSVLYSLFSQAISKLKNGGVRLINSRAHHTNHISINFHRKMGFREVQRNDKYIEFQILVPELLRIISQRLSN